MSQVVWGAGKNASGTICSEKHVGKHMFGKRARNRAVRKGGIIKGVWLPRGRHHPLRHSLEGVRWQRTEHCVVEARRPDVTMRQQCPLRQQSGGSGLTRRLSAGRCAALPRRIETPYGSCRPPYQNGASHVVPGLCCAGGRVKSQEGRAQSEE